MAEFCVIMDVTSHRFGHWGLITQRMLNKVFVSFYPGTGGWWHVDNVEVRQDVPQRIVDIHYH